MSAEGPFPPSPPRFSRFEGETAVVTASTAGIGLAIAYRLGAEGARVVISSRKEKSVREAVSRLKEMGVDAVGLVCNVSKDDDRKKLLEAAQKASKNGKIDILVSNAAASLHFGDSSDLEVSKWEKMFQNNVTASWLLVKEFKSSLSEKARILFVGSVLGFNPSPPLGCYGVTKTALLGLVKMLAVELGPDIRVNGLAPGIIKTNFSSMLWNSEEAEKASTSTCVLQRTGEAWEMAGPAAFLVSGDASYVTGETLVASGGTPASRL